MFFFYSHVSERAPIPYKAVMHRCSSQLHIQNGRNYSVFYAK